ncbi:MAG TPA: response regulator [Actinoplanes sp.]|jgi:CheY-like chemotaxis protein
MACIVIADDDVDVADFISYSFEAAGHKVHTALDGVSALGLARRYLPDLVVLDNGMPGLTGLEVVAALRGDAGTAHLPILMITASDLGDEAANVDMLVRKPLRPRQLTTLMADMLARGNRPETMSAD